MSNRDGNFEIFLWDERTGIRQITSTPAGISNLELSINADGTRIVFDSNRDGNSEIFLFDTTTNELIQITNTPTGISNVQPSINADGTRIAFVRNFEIFRYNTTTNELIQITNTALDVFNRPSINADGTRIAFDSVGGGDSEIFLAECVTPLVFVPGIAGSVSMK